MNIGERLVELRKKNNYTQEQLAEFMKVTRQTISNWECGVTVPDLYQAMELANLYEIKIDDLVTEDKDDYNTIFHIALFSISYDVTAFTYNTFFKDITFNSFDKGILTINVPNNIIKSFLEKNYNDLITEKFNTYLDNLVSIKYLVEGDSNGKEKED